MQRNYSLEAAQWQWCPKRACWPVLGLIVLDHAHMKTLLSETHEARLMHTMLSAQF